MSKIQTEDPRFVRDMHSKALLSTDRNALNKHRMQRQQAQNYLKERENTSAEIEQLKNTVTRIEQLLMKVLEKDKDGS